MTTAHCSGRYRLALVTAAVMFLPLAAHADLGDQGDFSISVDRLFGYNNSKTTRSSGNLEATDSSNTLSLLMPAAATAHTSPRVALDFAIANRVTVGGAIGVIIGSSSGTRSLGNLSAETDGSSGNGLLLAPRAGFVLGLGASTKLWLRGGVTYFYNSSKNEDTNFETSSHGVALSLEPTLAFALAEHAALTVGAVIDLPLSGESKITNGNTSTTSDTKIRNLGLVVGFNVPL